MSAISAATTPQEIISDILEIYHTHKTDHKIDVSFFTDYDKVKSRIVFKLINYERNRELLADIPHYRYLDLAIVFNCLLESDFPGNATILIRNQHMKFWSITKDDLYALALSNTPRLLQYDLRNMSEFIKELACDSDLGGPGAPLCHSHVCALEPVQAKRRCVYSLPGSSSGLCQTTRL